MLTLKISILEKQYCCYAFHKCPPPTRCWSDIIQNTALRSANTTTDSSN